jgi:hypothetical protein
LPDGTHRDLTGGWHSAGDYNKLTWEYGDGGIVYALVHAVAAAPKYFASFDRDRDSLPDAIDEAEWGARYLLKLQQPDGALLNHIEQGPDRKTWMNWCPPEKMTDNIVGTPDDPVVREGEGNSPLAVGGWALLGVMCPAQGGRNPYLENAVRLWDHATEKEKTPGSPLLLLSGIDLYKITRDQRYLERDAAPGVESASRLQLERQAAHQQTGARDQDERPGELADDERPSNAQVDPTAPRTASAQEFHERLMRMGTVSAHFFREQFLADAAQG